MKQLIKADMKDLEVRTIADRQRLFGTAKIPILLTLARYTSGRIKSMRVARLYSLVVTARGSHSRASVYSVVDLLIDDGFIAEDEQTRIGLTSRGVLLCNAMVAGWQPSEKHPTDLRFVGSRASWPDAAARTIQAIYCDLLSWNI